MKKNNLIILALVLASCGGSQQQNQNSVENNSQNATEQSEIQNFENIEGNPAYDVSKMLNSPNSDWSYTPDKNKLKFSFNSQDEEYDLDVTNTVQCYPMDGGGYLAIHTITKEGFLGDGFIDEVAKFDVYTYQDGKLTPQKDVLPQPKYQDFEANDELLAKGQKTCFEKECKKQEDYIYRLFTGQKIQVGALEDEAFPNTFYEWDGKKFVPINSTSDTRKYNVARPGALAILQTGSTAPKDLKGYQTEKKGNNLIFKRNGKDEFILSLGANDAIDTITIVGERLTYAMCSAGGCNPFGVGFSPVDDSFGMQYSGVNDYFVFKNGVWVRVIENEDGIIEFYTTKDALKNEKGSEGKTVKPSSEDPFSGKSIANEKAKVSLVKIYKSNSFCETCFQKSDEENVVKIRKMYNDIINNKDLIKKSIEIEDEESGYPAEYNYFYNNDKLVMIEFSSGDGTMYDQKIYMENGYAYFSLVETTYPDNSKKVERIYICAGKIFKYLDNNKKELDVNRDDDAVRAQTSLNTIVNTALKHEKEAK